MAEISDTWLFIVVRYKQLKAEVVVFWLMLVHFLCSCLSVIVSLCPLSVFASDVRLCNGLPHVCTCACFHNTKWHELFCASSENGIIKSDKVYEVMLATDRAHFSRCNPYMDSPQSIGKSVTIHTSQHITAHHSTASKPNTASTNQICASLLTKRIPSNHQRPTHGMTFKTL